MPTQHEAEYRAAGPRIGPKRVAYHLAILSSAPDAELASLTNDVAESYMSVGTLADKVAVAFLDLVGDARRRWILGRPSEFTAWQHHALWNCKSSEAFARSEVYEQLTVIHAARAAGLTAAAQIERDRGAFKIQKWGSAAWSNERTRSSRRA